MDRFDRIYALHKELVGARRPISSRVLQERLECARATLNRIIEDLRDHLGAPIKYDRRANGYHYAQTGEHPYELPGLWFNASELYSLLAAQKLLHEVQPGLLDADISPLRKRIEDILTKEKLGSGDLPRRVRILKTAARSITGHTFQTIAGALLQRKRLHIRYHDRQTDQVTDRAISPQRLVHYRDNWYLDVWCHLRDALRTFSLDRIRHAKPLGEKANDIEDAHLDAHFTRSYGIFAGDPTHTTILRFTPERARWVAEEHWHPDQQGQWLEDGRYELRIPYGNPRELIMDILKYGPEVEVVGPEGLRQAVAHQVRQMAMLYSENI